MALPPKDAVQRRSGWADKFNPVKLIGKKKDRTLPTPAFKTPPEIWMEPLYRKSDDQQHPWTLPGLEEVMVAQGGTAKDAWNLWLELRPCVWLQVQTVDGGEQGCYTKDEVKKMYPDHPLEMWNELVFKSKQLEQQNNPVKNFAKNHWKKMAVAAGLAAGAYGGYVYRAPIMNQLERVLPESIMGWLRGVTGVASAAPQGYNFLAGGERGVGRPALGAVPAHTPEQIAGFNFAGLRGTGPGGVVTAEDLARHQAANGIQMPVVGGNAVGDGL